MDSLTTQMKQDCDNLLERLALIQKHSDVLLTNSEFKKQYYWILADTKDLKDDIQILTELLHQDSPNSPSPTVAMEENPPKST
jgi:hypothetical protein